MKTPRLVFACNHYVKETYSENFTKQVERSTVAPELSESIDEIWLQKYCYRDIIISPDDNLPDGNIIITDSECKSVAYDKDEPFSPVFSLNTVTYREGYDYDIVVKSARKGQYVFVDWIKDRATNTELPEMYQIKLWYDRHFSKQYSTNDCPRCCGDRWYAGLFESGATNAELIGDANRLIQAFFKYIYTRKQDDGFGSTLLSAAGKYTTADEKMLGSIISSEIDAFAVYYKNQTSVMMLEGNKFSDDEILTNYYISDITMEDYSIKARVRFYTKSGSDLSVDIVLPDEN